MLGRLSSALSTTTTSSEIGDFLDRVYSHTTAATPTTSNTITESSDLLAYPGHNQRPFVTLTYAQSLDGKIAGIDGQQLRLSGNQSMKMTHLLRARHDGILVGIGTLLSDDPQLNARNISISVPIANQPQPIVIDTSLRTPIDCKLIKNFRNQLGKQPWLICARSEVSLERRQELENAGARVIPITNGMNTSKKGLDIEKVLEVCKLNGINKLMIEGGAAIISSILNQVLDNPILNILIVTVSPYMVGEGIGIKSSNIDSLSLLRHLETKIMGLDAVFAYTTTSATEG
ncbi:riboflavin biosynthesis protein RibD domain-containing protein [Puccinia striiformis f. sp. tritici PST-78]|uniref:2,5-diamino-6-ribosylamino-4(3H)-pyrimidinone 5'-phosphate reductase n=1 Tax=Puccinia striiformis f. sp. tritici PST-78 TaxID=1165861 RepID=A0A0L0W510_9BASI|nr:riboflavin biosynthesis protein RibD domain-containing protein [Puccinia striiformis f. sp. tritici PST-78]